MYLSPGASPLGYRSFSTAPTDPLVIDNNAYVYVLAWGAPDTSPTSTRFAGVRVEYKLN
jgi:hypothetical protein